MSDKLRLVHSNQTLEDVRGQMTTTVVSDFGNNFVIYVTQYGRIGTIIHANASVQVDCAVGEVYTVTALFGKEELAYVALARQLIECVYKSTQRQSILLAISLKDKSTDTLKSIKEIIMSKIVR